MRSLLVLTLVFGCLHAAAGAGNARGVSDYGQANATVADACASMGYEHGASSGRRVIDADMLRATGATRLTDILRLLEDWNLTTVDGFTWQMSPFGLDAYQTQPWIVMVDGVRMDIGQFGVSSLNRIPVNVSEIDSVEILDLPQLHHGEFIDGGLIHIHTHGAGKSGFGMEGSAVSGNPTGDPGPWRYTDEATPNVDKVGPDFWADVRYRDETGHGGGDAAYVQRRHYPTQNETRQRNLNMAAGAYPQMNVYAPAARLRARALGGEHHVFAGYSAFEDYFFFKPYGREIPVTTKYAVGGLSGTFDRGARKAVAYRLVYGQNTIDYRRNSFELDFDWERSRLAGGLELGIGAAGRRRHTIGIGAEYVRASTNYELTEDDFWLTTFYAQSRWVWATAVRQVIGLAITGGGGDAAFNVMTSCVWRPGAGVRVEAAAAYVERLPEQDGRIWFWRERGYDFLTDAGVEVDAGARLGTARRLSVDASVGSSESVGPRSVMELPAAGSSSDVESPAPAGGTPASAKPWRYLPFTWRIDGYYRGCSGQYIETQQFAFDPDEWAFNGPVRLNADQEGDVTGCQVTAQSSRIPRVRLRTVYRYQRWISGDDAFRRLWSTVPRHHFRQLVSYTPVPGFTLWGQLNYTSSSDWFDYRDAAEQSQGFYSSRVEDFVTLDAAAEKWFWSRRLRGSLLFKDLFNQSPRYHPIGASFGLSAFVQVEMMLGSAER